MRTVDVRPFVIQAQYFGLTLVRHGHFRAVSRRMGNPRLHSYTFDIIQVVLNFVYKRKITIIRVSYIIYIGMRFQRQMLKFVEL